ncbi:MAG: Gfo/Idh/MocA family oxidoreductase [Hydrococcus sp. C42_A2020_068]|uniref:Gfo/Idh/MocA family protein n=1 Tax=Pleurocapsa sp. PCC 7327 TaxID=118163 RepID=UPI00029F88AB|nr:Gfo/Idh/MocA family oxidoreductase [Pleurocapsa sp. PCC 7327]AFY76007.1 putative dehydrogenase [Pleurocapsa sp. PCC 7327]MBF2021877.1 Gfo/Idh/MocA family oxidoreductase [Hydrococcus sp. C42_A2020_068]
MKTGIAILGVGRWGVHWVRNFFHHPQAEVLAIVDRSAQRLAECREKFHLDETKVVLAKDWEAVRQLKGINAVVVATPASTHYPLIADALRLGYHVLAEKPLTLDPSECLELTRLAQQQQRQLLVDHTYLFHPAVERGRQVARSQQLGELRYGYANRTHLGPVRQDVDALWDLAIHDIAIFNDWLGQIPTQVQARGSVWLQEGLPDLVWATLIYPNGFQAILHLCWLNPDKQRRLCLVGTQGSLIFDEMNLQAPLMLQHGHFQKQGEGFIPVGQSSEVLEIEAAEPLKKVCDRFLQMIGSRETCSFSSGWIGAQLVQILSCLSLSLQRRGEIISVPQLHQSANGE